MEDIDNNLPNTTTDSANNEVIPSTTIKEVDETLLDQIVKSDNPDEIKDLTKLFNLNQNKKNLVRIAKLNDLLDKVSDKAIERIDINADDISDKDLLGYMQTVQNVIEKSQKSVEDMSSVPMIQINQQNNINVEGELSRESKEKVLSIINMFREMAQQTSTEEIKEDEKGED